MRYKNGYVDDGSLVNNNDPSGQKCPNCHSRNFKETVSKEYCWDCGYEVDYWGKGGNDIALSCLNRIHEKNENARREERRKEQEEWKKEFGIRF